MNFRLGMLIFFIFMTFTLLGQNVINIDFAKAKHEKVDVSRLYDQIEYVPLELSPKALIKIKNATYYLSDKYIIAVNFFVGAYLFDRKSGKFIREVSKFGSGPKEYTFRMVNYYGFDETNKILFADEWNKWKGFDINSNEVALTIKKPAYKSQKNNLTIYSPWILSKDKYVSFVNNQTGKDAVKLVIYNKEGVVLKSYSNDKQYKDVNHEKPFDYGIFYNYKKVTYFKEVGYNNTVYSVSEKGLIPHIVFNLGSKEPSYMNREEKNYNKDKFFIDFVHETDSYVFFNYYTLDDYYSQRVYYTGYFDKKSKQTYICNNGKEKSGYYKSNLPPMIPRYITGKGEMLFIIDPSELIEYREKGKNTDKKIQQIVANVNEDDNPIIVLAY